MKKVIVIGCPGGGKSTFSKALHKKIGIPLYHLDRIYWNADRTTVAREVFDERLQSIIRTDRWIIDGNYGRTMEERLKPCDTVFFFDIPTEVCLQGIADRVGKKRSDMPWIEQRVESEFVQFVRNFNTDSRPKIVSLLQQYSEKDIVVFTSHADADAFLKNIR